MCALLAASHPLPPTARAALLEHCAREIANLPELGDGVLHRMIVRNNTDSLQRRGISASVIACAWRADREGEGVLCGLCRSRSRDPSERGTLRSCSVHSPTGMSGRPRRASSRRSNGGLGSRLGLVRAYACIAQRRSCYPAVPTEVSSALRYASVAGESDPTVVSAGGAATGSGSVAATCCCSSGAACSTGACSVAAGACSMGACSTTGSVGSPCDICISSLFGAECTVEPTRTVSSSNFWLFRKIGSLQAGARLVSQPPTPGSGPVSVVAEL
jgi:hypothetical protein